jgi:nitroreductase
METQILTMPTSSTSESPVIGVIEKRRSLRAYSASPVEEEKIKSLFEAARWTPSSMNEQPWFYIYATKNQPEVYSILLGALSESNRVWAKEAPLLIFSMTRRKHLRNGIINHSANYDLGAANAFLTLQATAFGLNVHQMGGYDRAKLFADLNISAEEYDPGVVMAIGYPGHPELLSENLQQREHAPRQRYTVSSFVMNKGF